MIEFDDKIGDDELQVLGKPKQQDIADSGDNGNNWLWKVIALVLLCTTIVIICISRCDNKAANCVKAVDTLSQVEKEEVRVVEPKKPLGSYSDNGEAYVEHIAKEINDIVLDIYIPHNAEPKLAVGRLDKNDSKILFAAQAADIRADNHKITGAYVLAGQPLCWGLSKKGYVSIIDGKIIIGVSENSPLFEEATEKNGYFFRQYPLVDNGVLVENEPKGKAVRKAVCSRGEETFVVFTTSKESMHDFAQALVDLGVDNAVYLVGSQSNAFMRERNGDYHRLNNKWRKEARYTNYIIWVRKVEQ